MKNVLHKHDKRVFVLGDSRTGTSSLNSYLLSLGIKSKHYYVKESEQTAPDHLNRELNWKNLKNYVENSGYAGYTDYPTRLYYKELFQLFPDAYFILTLRESTDTWKKSMMTYFPKFGITLNEEKIVENYEKINSDIIDFFNSNESNFLMLNIDGDDRVNSSEIKKFLGIVSLSVIGKENTTEDIDIENVTKRKILFRYDKENWVDYLESVCSENKAILSEKGWLYLINDSNDFIRWSYGLREWTGDQYDKVKSILDKRVEELSSSGTQYLMYITPEKNVLYDEYLPHIFDEKIISNKRPACLMEECNENVYYLDKYLRSLKGFGRLYFKGDSHVNWLGAYYIYRHIHAELSKRIANIGRPSELSDLTPNIANYKGDLYTQASESQLTDVHGVWGCFNLKDSLGYEVQYSVTPSYKYVSIPNTYKEKYGTSRDIIITEHSNADLPTAVVFRDSTCDFIQPLLSNHFSRVVYIWHKGLVYREILNEEDPDVVLHMVAERFVSNYYQNIPVS